ncbi:MAG: DUF726 domain-containing protein, partial [Bacteroidetes bacterium]
LQSVPYLSDAASIVKSVHESWKVANENACVVGPRLASHIFTELQIGGLHQSVTLVAHSLGASVCFHALQELDRLCTEECKDYQIRNVVLLGAAVSSCDLRTCFEIA